MALRGRSSFGLTDTNSGSTLSAQTAPHSATSRWPASVNWPATTNRDQSRVPDLGRIMRASA
jgi:hypothetical protein